MKSRAIKASLLLLTILIVGILIWVNKSGKLFDSQSLTSQEFTGTLESYEGNILVAGGIYTLETANEAEVQEIKKVEIIVGPNTKITRTLLTLPTAEELKKTNGYFESDKLKKVESQVDLATLQKDTDGFGMGIFAKSDRNIFGASSFTATEINYRVVTRP